MEFSPFGPSGGSPFGDGWFGLDTFSPQGTGGVPAGYMRLRGKSAGGSYSPLSGKKADASRVYLVGKAS